MISLPLFVYKVTYPRKQIDTAEVHDCFTITVDYLA